PHWSHQPQRSAFALILKAGPKSDLGFSSAPSFKINASRTVWGWCDLTAERRRRRKASFGRHVRVRWRVQRSGDVYRTGPTAFASYRSGLAAFVADHTGPAAFASYRS